MQKDFMMICLLNVYSHGILNGTYQMGADSGIVIFLKAVGKRSSTENKNTEFMQNKCRYCNITKLGNERYHSRAIAEDVSIFK